MGPTRSSGCPARRAARIANSAPFSGTSRPDHSGGPPPGPGLHLLRSMPLRMTRIAGTACRQACEVLLLTAVKITGHGPACTADSSHGVGGVCNVEIIGTGTRQIGRAHV